MSHAKERKEKNCLNCNAIVAGRFCAVCGQENIEIHETFGHLAGHLISDIFHFDGMFFSTAKYLLFRPGFLTYEYMRGRRASYLHPVKMYVFISAIFFLIFLSFFKPELDLGKNETKPLSAVQVKDTLLTIKNTLTSSLQSPLLSAMVKEKTRDKIKLIDNSLLILQKDTSAKLDLLNDINAFYISNEGTLVISENGYKTEAQYDSMQQKLPPAKRDNWFLHKLTVRGIAVGNQFRQNRNGTAEILEESFFHHFPQMLFISLPLFSLVLALLYVRRRAYNYGSHLIFTVHLYCAVFVFTLLLIILYQAARFPGFHWLSWVAGIVLLYTIFYTYAAMHNFYAQSIGKTLVKWILLYAIGVIIMIVLFSLLMMFTFFTF